MDGLLEHTESVALHLILQLPGSRRSALSAPFSIIFPSTSTSTSTIAIMLRLSTPLPSVTGCYLFSQATRARQSNHLGQLRCLSSGLGLGNGVPSVSLQVTGRTRCSKAVHALNITSRVGVVARQKQQRNQVTPSSPFSILPRTQVRYFTPSGRLRSSRDGEKGYVYLSFYSHPYSSGLIPLWTTILRHTVLWRTSSDVMLACG